MTVPVKILNEYRLSIIFLKQMFVRFLAGARNDSILCGIGESRGDSLSESPLLSPYSTTSPCHSERQQGISFIYFDLIPIQLLFIPDQDQKSETLSRKLSENIEPVKSETLSRIFQSTESLSFKLSWSHYVELIKMDQPERNFYEVEAVHNNWSVRELRRQYNSSLFEFTLPEGQDQIFSREYKLYLPDKEELKKQLEVNPE